MTDQWLWVAQYIVAPVVSGSLIFSFVAWRRDKRQSERDEIDVTDLIKNMVRAELIEAYAKIEIVNKKVEKLEAELSSAKQYIAIIITRWLIEIPGKPPPVPPKSLGLDEFLK